MVLAAPLLEEGYWETFSIESDDLEFIYNHLLEVETPQTSQELVTAVVAFRIQRERAAAERKRTGEGTVYLPKEHYQAGQAVIFPALKWKRAVIESIREGHNPTLEPFEVIRVRFDNGESREYASGLAEHVLNTPPDLAIEDPTLDAKSVIKQYGESLQDIFEDELATNPDFVRIAGKWFPRALLVDINQGHMNLAEAVLDMMNGGPLPTQDLMEQIGLANQSNLKLVEFSLDLALQEDPRFDEVGPSGKIVWFLNRLEPEDVLKVNPFLRYEEIEHDRSLLDKDMLALERQLDDELTPFSGRSPHYDEVNIPLLFPHWAAGTLPLSTRLRQFFPTAYEAPRIRFTLVDGDSGQQFSGWVVRPFGYISGLKDWYRSKGLFPGSLIRVRRGANPGEVIVTCESRRSTRDWLRTVLVGSDGGVSFYMLKQNISTLYDDRMAVFVPDPESQMKVWNKNQLPFERMLVNVVRELAKLNPQNHVHASELYAAINTIRRCPPGPILAMLVSRPWFVHVGDLHFRFDDSEQ
jgi:hypothetical protein